MLIAEEMLEKADRLAAEADSMEGRIGLLRATLNLSDHPYWEEYKKSLLTFMNNLNNQLLDIRDNGDLGVVDRRRVARTAEIRLLGFIVRAPERFKEELRQLSESVDRKRKEAAEIQKKYGFVRKGVQNG